MNKLFTVGLIAVLVIGLITALPLTPTFAASSQQKAVDKALGKIGWKNLCIVSTTTKTNNQSQVAKDFKCTGTNPPPPPGSVIPALNKTKNVRIGVIGDVDNNNGLVVELNLFKKYQVQFLVIIGDFGYTSGQGVLDKITAAGFTKDNTVIILGNHDSCSLIKTWTGDNACFGDHFLKNVSSKINIQAIDGNSNFGCGTAQYNVIKSDIESSDAWYNIPAIHQPFVTGPSHHSPNGQFDCYQALFLNNEISLVLEAHNHNYQRFFIDPVVYWLVGTGTHDTNGGMYPISSNAQFDGKTCSKCFTGTNGVGIMDVQIDHPSERHINGYFVSQSEKLMDSFVISK